MSVCDLGETRPVLVRVRPFDFRFYRLLYIACSSSYRFVFLLCSRRAKAGFRRCRCRSPQVLCLPGSLSRSVFALVFGFAVVLYVLLRRAVIVVVVCSRQRTKDEQKVCQVREDCVSHRRAEMSGQGKFIFARLCRNVFLGSPSFDKMILSSVYVLQTIFLILTPQSGYDRGLRLSGSCLVHYTNEWHNVVSTNPHSNNCWIDLNIFYIPNTNNITC